MPSPPIVFVIEICYNICSRIYIIVYDKLTRNQSVPKLLVKDSKFQVEVLKVLFISR
jgi:hypothetical protein